jgi:hypothetical protein
MLHVAGNLYSLFLVHLCSLFFVHSAFAMSGGLEPHPSDPILSSVVGLYSYNHVTRLGTSCTGTIIGSQTIITAAHCLIFDGPADIEVFISSGVQPFKILFQAAESGDRTSYARTKNFLPHPKYNPASKSRESLGYDVALLFLDSPQMMPMGLKPINLIHPYTLSQLPERGRVFGAGSGSGPRGLENVFEEQRTLIGSFEITKDVTKIMAAVDIQSPDQIEEGWLTNFNQPQSSFILATPTHAHLQKGDSGSGLIQDYYGTPRLIGVYKGQLTINEKSAGHSFANLHEPALNRWVRSHLK